MSRWFRMNNSALDDPRVQRLPPDEFKAAFMSAYRGEESPFSVHLKAYTCRPSAADWAKTRARIFARDDYTCQYCGERGKRLECDHVLPVARGGTEDDGNLVTACRKCNRSKAAKLLNDWRPQMAQICPLSGLCREG